MEKSYQEKLQHRIKVCMAVLIAGLFLSGLTAFPIEQELGFLVNYSSIFPRGMEIWLGSVYQAVRNTNIRYPFLSYGTDWLAFAHILLAILFMGPYRQPVRNIWIIDFGMIACILIVPLAFIAGYFRGIPFFWRLIDCSFGVLAYVPLYLSSSYAHLLSRSQILTRHVQV